MATNNPPLPEGTDTIITGASAEDIDDFEPAVALLPEPAPEPSEPAPTGPAPSLREAAVGQASDLKSQATDRAREFAVQGKERATDALDNVAKLVQDAASRVDEQLGEQYGAYARRAADAVTGVADGLRNKDVDELIEDARGLIRNSPALAIGAAATLGFVIARIAKAAVPDTAGPGSTATTEKDVAFDPDSKTFGGEG